MRVQDGLKLSQLLQIFFGILYSLFSEAIYDIGALSREKTGLGKLIVTDLSKLRKERV